jgi:hypothetical protein
MNNHKPVLLIKLDVSILENVPVLACRKLVARFLGLSEVVQEFRPRGWVNVVAVDDTMNLSMDGLEIRGKGDGLFLDNVAFQIPHEVGDLKKDLCNIRSK